MDESNEELLPIRATMYRKHYEAIKWLRENYVTDKNRGDQIIADIVNDEDVRLQLAQVGRKRCKRSAAGGRMDLSEKELDRCQELREITLVLQFIYDMKCDYEAESGEYLKRKVQKI